MRAASLTGLALRELWISFRLLVLLVLPLAGGIATAVLPTVAPDARLLAWILAGSAVVASAVAAGALAGARRHGEIGWLVLRAVPRSSVLLGWFAGTVLPVLAGTAAAAILAWLALHGGPLPDLDLIAFALVAAAAAGALVVAVAVGLLVGALLWPLPAALLAGALTAAGLAAGLLAPVNPTLWPGGGLALLAQAGDLERPISGALQSLGLELAASGLLLAAASALLGRSDL